MKYLDIDMNWVKIHLRKHILPAVRPMYMPANTILFSYGSRGTAVYLLEEGLVELTDAEGAFMAVLSPGSVFGQLAMLYDSPRQCTVTCLENCKLWSMGRQQYLSLQRAVHSQMLSANARRLYDVLEVKALPNVYVERLMSTLVVEHFADGENVLTTGKGNTKVAVIESGYVHLHFDQMLLRRSPEELLRALGIEVDLAACQGHCQGKWEIILSTPVFEAEVSVRVEEARDPGDDFSHGDMESSDTTSRAPSPAPSSSPLSSRPGSATPSASGQAGPNRRRDVPASSQSVPVSRSSTPPPATPSSSASPTISHNLSTTATATAVRSTPVKPSVLLSSTGKIFTRNARSISPAQQLPPLDIPGSHSISETLRSAVDALDLNPDEVGCICS